MAQKWANKLAAEEKMYHSSCPYGENIYSQYSSTNKAADGRVVAESWYSEIKDYKGSFENAGNLTNSFIVVNFTVSAVWIPFFLIFNQNKVILPKWFGNQAHD